MLYIVSLGDMIFDSLLALAGSGPERSVTYVCTNLLLEQGFASGPLTAATLISEYWSPD